MALRSRNTRSTPMRSPLCGRNLRILLTLLLVLEVGIFVYPTLTYVYNTQVATVLPGMLAALTNEERVRQSLPELRVSKALSEAATLKAQDMAEKGYFAHVSPDGKEPWYWLEQVAYEYDYAGENLAMNFTDSKDVTAAWMNSPTHRANIVKAAYTEVGTGVAHGIYAGKETIFVAQVYAHPARGIVDTAPASDGEAGNAATDPITTELSGSAVLGAETETAIKEDASSFLAQLLVSPRHTMVFVLGGFAGAILLMLLAHLYYTRKCRCRPGLITNGVIFIFVLVTLFFANFYFSTRGIESTSTEYTAEDVQGV